MHNGHGLMWRIRAQTIQAPPLDATVVSAKVNVAANAVMGPNAREVAMGHRRMMGAGNVVRCAIGLMNVGQSQKRSRPTWFTMKKPR
jgi:hypothetical protein